MLTRVNRCKAKAGFNKENRHFKVHIFIIKLLAALLNKLATMLLGLKQLRCCV